jgi:hypothetical protein
MKIPVLARAPDIRGEVLDSLLVRYDHILDLAINARITLGREFRFRYTDDLNLLMDVQIINRLYRFRNLLDRTDMYVFAEHGHIVFMDRSAYRAARRSKISH